MENEPSDSFMKCRIIAYTSLARKRWRRLSLAAIYSEPIYPLKTNIKAGDEVYLSLKDREYFS